MPSAAKTPDRFCHAHPRRVFCTAGLDPGRNRMFRALRSPQQKPRSPGLRRTKNAVGRYLFRKKRLPHRVDLADWRFEARLAHYRRLQIGAARPLVVFWQTRPAPVPIVGAISAHKPQGAGPLGGGIASACVVYLRLTRQAYGSAHGRRRSTHALPVLRLADAVQAPTFKRRFGFRLSQL